MIDGPLLHGELLHDGLHSDHNLVKGVHGPILSRENGQADTIGHLIQLERDAHDTILLLSL